MGYISAQKTWYSHLISGFVMLAILLFSAGSAFAGTVVTQCNDCHGMPPKDAVRTGNPNFRSNVSATVGNHQAHLPATVTAANCVVCHGAAVSALDHQDDQINMAASGAIKGGAYAKGVFFNQTSLPALTNAKCSNVSCHFETITPAWGSASWSSSKAAGDAGNCSSCHNGAAALASGAHSAHIAVFGGTGTTASCQKCHPNHDAAGAAAFSHATSVSRSIRMSFTAAPNSGTGTYTGGRTSANVMPSAAVPAAGTCNSLYCHSSGQATPAYKNPIWTGTLGCNGCHGTSNAYGAPDYTNAAAPNQNSHAAHASSAADCIKCHTGTVTAAGTAILGGSVLHINSSRDVNIAAAYDTNSTTTNYTASTKTCASISCHGAATPVWGGATLLCNSCHSASNTLAGQHSKHYEVATLALLGDKAASNNSTGTIYEFSCGVCHNPGATSHSGGVVSANQAAQVAFDPTIALGGTYVAGGTLAGTDAGMAWTAGTCSATYCHSQGTSTTTPFGGAANLAATWATAQTLTCEGCHSFNAAATNKMATGKHTAHINNAAVLGTNISCQACHSTTTTDGTTITNTANHVNKIKDVSMQSGGTWTSPGCTLTYCHSSGQATPVYVNPGSWTAGTALGCNGCHGTGNAYGSPDYVNAAAPNQNSHAAHTSSAADCIKCHTGTVTAAGTAILGGSVLHTNSSRDVNIAAAYDTNGATANYTAATKTCASISCHGAATPAWGGATLLCNSCHSANNTLAGKHSKHYGVGTVALLSDKTASNTSAGTVYEYSCGVCHNPGTTSHSGGVVSVNQAAEVSFDPSIAVGGTYAAGGALAGTDAGMAWTAGTCSATYCHSQGTSTTAPFGGAANVAATWATAQTLTCEGCHGFNAAAINKMATGKHTTHINSGTIMTNVACSACHVSTTSNSSSITNTAIHANKVKEVTIAATYDSDATPTNNWTSGTQTCTNVYCHSDGQAAPNYKTVVWTATISGCKSCHNYDANSGAGAIMVTGKHAEHINQAAVLGTNYGCQDCHSTVTTNGTSISTPANHINKTRDINMTTRGGGTWTSPNCTATYCHSSGQATPVYVNPGSWTAGAVLGCNGCHGTGNAFGSPSYTTANSHSIHAASAADCVKCHTGTVTAAGTAILAGSVLHTNSLRDVNFAAAYDTNGATTNYTAGTKTCSATNCHGQGAPTWGATVAAPVNGFPYSATQCETCHGSAATTPFYSTAIPKVTATTDAHTGAHSDHLSATRSISSAIACLECHTVPATVTAAGHMDGATLVAFNGTLAKSNTTTATSCATTWCHGGNTTLIPQNNPVRTAPVWSTRFPTTSILGTGGPVGTSGSGYCAQCHGYPPLTASHTGKAASTCIGCHTHINNDGLTFNDKTKHINGIIEATGGHVFPYSGSLHLSAAGTNPWTSCVTSGCHTNAAGSYPVAAGTAPNCQACHISGLKVPSGTSSCWDCHGASATNGLPTGTTFPNIAGSHTAHAAVTAACTTCHTGGGNGVVTHGSSNRTAASAATVRVAFTGQGTSPAWTFATRTCSATNCHGQGAPTWGATVAVPVSGFPYSATQCETCHGSAATNPFYSTAIPKVTATTDAHTGAHTDHLSGTKNISSAIACLECHAVPATVTAAGHMDGTTLVAYNGTLAKSNTTTATSCATTWCHGGNTTLIPQNSTARTAPVWGTRFPTTSTLGTGGTAGTSGSGYCAQCHGYPPLTTSHTNKTATTCVGCHSHINGDALTFSDKTKHINGSIEAANDCNSCHAYDVTGSTWNVAGRYDGGAWGTAPGAHVQHINFIKARLGGNTYTLNPVGQTYGVGVPKQVCGTCHSNNEAVDHNNSARNINFGGGPTYEMGPGHANAKSLLYVTGTNPSYSAANRTCSNLSCHYFTTPAWF